MRREVAQRQRTVAPAQIVSARDKAVILKAVADKHNGQLTPDLVVKESDPSNRSGVARRLSPLIWSDDDATAARRYREDLARTVIRSCEPELIQLGVIQIEAPHYVRDPSKGPREQGYVALMSVKSESDYAVETMRTETDRATSSLQRAYSIAMALEMEEDAAGLYGALAALGRAPAAVGWKGEQATSTSSSSKKQRSAGRR